MKFTILVLTVTAITAQQLDDSLFIHSFLRQEPCDRKHGQSSVLKLFGDDAAVEFLTGLAYHVSNVVISNFLVF